MSSVHGTRCFDATFEIGNFWPFFYMETVHYLSLRPFFLNLNSTPISVAQMPPKKIAAPETKVLWELLSKDINGVNFLLRIAFSNDSAVVVPCSAVLEKQSSPTFAGQIRNRIA